MKNICSIQNIITNLAYYLHLKRRLALGISKLSCVWTFCFSIPANLLINCARYANLFIVIFKFLQKSKLGGFKPFYPFLFNTIFPILTIRFLVKTCPCINAPIFLHPFFRSKIHATSQSIAPFKDLNII